MERTKYYRKGSHQLHSKLNEDIHVHIPRDQGQLVGQNVAAKTSAASSFAETSSSHLS